MLAAVIHIVVLWSVEVYNSYMYFTDHKVFIMSNPFMVYNVLVKGYYGMLTVVCLWQDVGFVVLPTDILEIDIRDKFSVRNFRFSHFLGRAKVPVNQFVRSTSSQ